MADEDDDRAGAQPGDDERDAGRARSGFGPAVRRLALAWGALVVLMLASLGSAWLPLGAANLAIGLAIAAAKTAIVVWLFMELRRASAMTRIAAAVGLATLLLLMSLSFTDYATRRTEPARWQQPRQLAPPFDRTGPR